MRLHALTRSLFVATALLMGTGQALSALAHGAAHAHEAEHLATAEEIRNHGHAHEGDDEHGFEHAQAPESAREFAPDEHHHKHQHAIVEAGLKSRSDSSPFIGRNATTLPAFASTEGALVAARTFGSAPPPERRHSPASPRAPPVR